MGQPKARFAPPCRAERRRSCERTDFGGALKEWAWDRHVCADPGGIAACSRWLSAVCETAGGWNQRFRAPAGAPASLGGRRDPCRGPETERFLPVVSQEPLHHRLQAAIPPGSILSQPPRLPLESLHFREGQRPDLCQPRPSAWVRMQQIIKALKGRPNPEITLVKGNFAGWRYRSPLQGWLFFLDPPRPLAWAGIICPFGAKSGIAYRGLAL